MIILGHGIFSIAGIDIGATKGGGQFTVEREFKEIEADGDKGPVKGRISKDKSIPKLTVNALEVIAEDFNKYYSALSVAKEENKITITGKDAIEESDYQTVTWTGKDNKGKAVIITLENAINLENIDWALQPKDEIINSLTYVGTYEEDSDVEPWKIEIL